MVKVEILPTLAGAYLRVHGVVDEQSREVLSCMLDHVVDRGTRRAVVDLRRVRKIDAAGLETLERAELSLQKLGGTLTVVGARP